MTFAEHVTALLRSGLTAAELRLALLDTRWRFGAGTRSEEQLYGKRKHA